MRKLLVALILLVQLSFSTIVVNSLDGRDVVSATYYSLFTDDQLVFIPPSYSQAEVYGKIGSGGGVFLIQSEESPAITGLAYDLESRDNTVDVYISEEPYLTNLELAGRSGATKFILIDPVYGYNAVSALGYAKLNSMYLLFVDAQNVEEVVSFLQTKGSPELLLYGYVESDVKGLLDELGFEYTAIDNGDKFDDNLELMELYLQKNPSMSQVILSDGNGLDDTISAADTPVVLVSPLIPSSTYNFLRENAASGQIPVALVVDQEYAQAAYDLKTSINDDVGSEVLHVFVKFGETSSISGGMKDVEFFPLPGPLLGLAISDAEYNTATGKLEVTYSNTGNAPEYVKANILVFADGTYVGTVGDEEPFAIGREEIVGRGYDIYVEEGTVTANITAMFGSSRKSTENGIQTLVDVGTVELVDESILNVTDFTVDASTMDLFVTYSNAGDSQVFFAPYVFVDVEGRTTKLEDGQVYTLSVGESRMLKFPGIVKEESTITAGASYGSREAFLEKNVEREYVPEVAAGLDLTLVLVGVIVLVVILAGAYVLMRKKK